MVSELGRGQSLGRLGRQATLGGRRHHEVDDGTAAGADHVVVVLGEVLGQLVAGEVVVGDDAVDDVGLLEESDGAGVVSGNRHPP